jgi:hypothetical protein
VRTDGKESICLIEIIVTLVADGHLSTLFLGQCHAPKRISSRPFASYFAFELAADARRLELLDARLAKMSRRSGIKSERSIAIKREMLQL